MADEGYKTSTIYQARITLFNMLEFAKENDVILSNPCKKSVKSDMGKPSQKKEALTIDTQKKFLEYAKGKVKTIIFAVPQGKNYESFVEALSYD